MKTRIGKACPQQVIHLWHLQRHPTCLWQIHVVIVVVKVIPLIEVVVAALVVILAMMIIKCSPSHHPHHHYQELFLRPPAKKIRISCSLINSNKIQVQEEEGSQNSYTTWRINDFASHGSSLRSKYQTIEGKFFLRYYFDCYDIIKANHHSELLIWKRGPIDAETILLWISNSQRVLDITRYGQPNNSFITYDIHPPK